MSDKIVKIESEVVASAPGLLERALEEAPAVVAPSSLRPGAEKVYRFLNGLSELRNINIGLRTTAGELISMRSILVVKPEILVEISNYTIARAQENCNETGREMKYIVTAYLNSNALNELLISLTPTDIVSIDREQGQNKLETLGDMPPPNDAYSILGEMLRGSPAFQDMIGKYAAASRLPMKTMPLRKARDWQVPFERVRLGAGKTATVVSRVQAYFRGRRLVCSVRKEDSIEQVGDVYIESLLIGQTIQIINPVSTLFFSPGALGSDQNYDTAQPNLDISLTVRNANNFTVVFDSVMFGQIVD